MNSVVCIKAVPSTTEVKMDPVTNTLVRDGRQSVVNPFDQSALEVAVRLKERHGGEVCALSMGIPDTERLLRDCLARGADRGLLLSDRAFAGADTLATSYSLSCGLEALARQGWHTDLVVCGKMAVDGDTAQIGPELASVLGVPCVTDVCEIVRSDEQELVLRRATDSGEAVVRVGLPCVITVAKDVCTPRMPSIAGVRWGAEGPVEVRGAAAVGADPARIGLAGSPTQVVRSFTPSKSTGCVPIEGAAAEQAGKLVELFEEMGL